MPLSVLATRGYDFRQGQDGTLEATTISVGRDGITPPM
jgi:hypothetical protein